MKKLITYDHHTRKPTMAATFTLKKGKVEIDPPDAPKKHNMLKKLVGKGNKLVTPGDGKEYYDALSRLRGTFYEVIDDGKGDKDGEDDKEDESYDKRDKKKD